MQYVCPSYRQMGNVQFVCVRVAVGQNVYFRSESTAEKHSPHEVVFERTKRDKIDSAFFCLVSSACVPSASFWFVSLFQSRDLRELSAPDPSHTAMAMAASAQPNLLSVWSLLDLKKVCNLRHFSQATSEQNFSSSGPLQICSPDVRLGKN